MVEILGVDYSYAPPSPAGLVTAGRRFVVRYGAVGKPGKWLTAAEVKALRAAGVDIVANVEETAKAFQGTAAGVRHATLGDAFFRALGMPADRPIYFSVDWDAQPADWPAVDAALKGAASVLGPGRVGVYGSYDTIAHCVSAGTAAWFWQTYAWSGGKWHPSAHLQQYSNGHTLAGGTVDYDRATTTFYGQWGGAMATSQNGWTVDTTGESQDRADIYPGVPVPNGVRKGDVAVIFRYLAGRFHREVEPLKTPGCWGWYVKVIEGGTTTSNHASGTAIDLNAPQHPMGAVDTFSTAKQAAIRKILTSLGGTVRWGGDYSGRHDDMHFEINAGAAAVKTQADKIRAQEDDVALATDMITLTPDAAAAIGRNAGDQISAATLLQLAVIHATRSGPQVWNYQLEDPSSTTTPRATKSAAAFQRYVEIIAAQAATRAVSAVQDLIGAGAVDPQIVAAHVAEALAPRVDTALAELGQLVTDPISAEELQAALQRALTKAFAPPT